LFKAHRWFLILHVFRAHRLNVTHNERERECASRRSHYMQKKHNDDNLWPTGSRFLALLSYYPRFYVLWMSDYRYWDEVCLLAIVPSFHNLKFFWFLTWKEKKKEFFLVKFLGKFSQSSLLFAFALSEFPQPSKFNWKFLHEFLMRLFMPHIFTATFSRNIQNTGL
jgi:hypothetical protein